MNPFERWSVWVTSFFAVASGTGYFITKYLMTSADPYAVVNHPLQPLFLKVHVVTSPLLLFALGLIAVRHVWRHYRSGVRWSRKSGITIALAVVPMVVTGYLIQVLTSAGWIRAMAWAHVGFGFLYAVGFGVHSWVIRRREPPEPRFCDGRRSVRTDAERGDGGAAADPAPSDAAARNFSGPNAKDTVERSEMARTGRGR